MRMDATVDAQLERLRIQDGDALVVYLDTYQPDDVITRLQDTLKRVLERNGISVPVFIVEPGLRLEVEKREAAI